MTRSGWSAVVAPDKFKGSLTAKEAADHITTGLRRAAPDIEITCAPVADGGEGTVDALLASGFESVPVVVEGPTGEAVEARLAVRGETGVVELAEASGMRVLPGGRLDPMRASSRGTGELVVTALDHGCRELVLCLGGSACTDGGAGMVQALGVRLFDAHGHDLGPGGGSLGSLVSVDLRGLDPRLAGTVVTLASDVDNPLLGVDGAASVYAPQKGATKSQVAELEAALGVWSKVLVRAVGRDVAAAPGAGAAGGVGFAALALLGAGRRSGIDVVLDLIGFDALLPRAALVVTGEGSLDGQSLHGKAPLGVVRAASRHGVDAVALVGRCSLSSAELASTGLRAVYPLTGIEPDLDVCQRDAGLLLEQLAAAVVAPAWLTR